MGGFKAERVGTNEGEWGNPKWKGYIEMWENSRIHSEMGRYICGRMGGSKVERVGTYVGEYEGRKWKGQVEMWENGRIKCGNGRNRYG